MLKALIKCIGSHTAFLFKRALLAQNLGICEYFIVQQKNLQFSWKGFQYVHLLRRAIIVFGTIYSHLTYKFVYPHDISVKHYES